MKSPHLRGFFLVYCFFLINKRLILLLHKIVKNEKEYLQIHFFSFNGMEI